MTISSLTPELQLHIFSYLDKKSLSSISKTDCYFKSLAADHSLELAHNDPRIFQNLLDGHFTKTTIPFEKPPEFPLDTYYLYLVDGKPTLSPLDKGQYGLAQESDVNSRTKIIKHSYCDTFNKTIRAGNSIYKTYISYLYVNDNPAVQYVSDIAYLNGLIIYTVSTGGLYLLNRSEITFNWPYTQGLKICDNFYLQIVCDEKRGIIYGLTKDGVDVLNFNQPHKELPDEDLTIKAFATKFFANILFASVGFFLYTYKIHAITSAALFACAVAGGLIVGLAFAESLGIALGILIIGEAAITITLLAAGVLYGFVNTVIETSGAPI